MKKNLISILALVLTVSQISAKGLDSTDNKIEYAEKIWMSNGIHKMLNNLQTELGMDERVFTYFMRVQRSNVLGDQMVFFNQAKSDVAFISGKETGTYQQWLTGRQAFYTRQAHDFTEHSDSFIAKYIDEMGSLSSMTACTYDVNCVNIGFENNNYTTWNRFVDNACEDPYFGYGICHAFAPTVSTPNISIESGAGFDPIVGSNLPVVCPTGGSYSVRLENTVNGGHAARISRTFTVDAANSTFIYKYAVVLEDPGNSHPDAAKPFFSVKVFKIDAVSCGKTGEVDCAKYEVFANPENNEIKASFMQVAPGSPIYYKKWTEVAIPLADLIGQIVQVDFTVSDCAYGGHLGYAYIDGECLNTQPTIGPCIAGERELTAPTGYTSFWWTGDDIHGSNGKRKVLVSEGDYSLMATTITGCQQSYNLTAPSCAPAAPANCTISGLSASPGTCNATTNAFDLNGTLTFSGAPASGSLIITNGYLSQIYALPLTSPFNFTFKDLRSDGRPHALTARFYNGAFISDAFISCYKSIQYTAPVSCYAPPTDCPNCITSFSPEPGRYIISAWVKDLGAAADVETYLNPYLEIKFSGGSIVLPKMYGSGKIVDKWQRVFYEFNIPVGATDISINLGTLSGAVLFDDIRVHPANGSFVSYVYDPVSLKLVATLDDNNYATIYEYDNEGTLLRVKKETERGIMTIKESRESSPKR